MTTPTPTPTPLDCAHIWTPADARQLAGYVAYDCEVAEALRSLAKQVEVLSTKLIAQPVQPKEKS